jgi:hypothetical protein
MKTTAFSTRAAVGLWSVGLAVGVSILPAATRARQDDFDENAKNPIRTISTRPDRVSGGDVLVEISGTGRNKQPIDVIDIRVNGRSASSGFRPGTRPNTLMGLVTGLEIGRNKIAAAGDTLVVTNYPISGPITSGPHIKPFVCDTHLFKLPDGTPYTAQPIVDDPTCSAPTKINYLYMPAGGKELVPLPKPTEPPSDVVTTKTLTGAAVKFIVRVETSTINRGIYQSAILHDPAVDAEPSPFSPPKGWNRRLIAVEGFGCRGGWYRQGPSIGNLVIEGLTFTLLQPARLGEGYALFSNTLQHPSNNCNAVLSGEAAMMSKEHFIERHGEPSFTLSYGASGGSYGSFQLADAHPGLFDGVLVALTFPDPMSIALSGMDARLLATYFAGHKAADLTPGQKAAISGYKLSGPDGMLAMADAARQSGRADPIAGRVVPGIPEYDSGIHSAVPASDRYHPQTNARGARATVYDVARNVYGVNPRTGFALRTFDNVGVQYGLQAFTAGTISAKQFLDMNEAIGGLDDDANAIAVRSVGDRGAIQRAYQSGLQLAGSGGLASIPVVNVTGRYNEDGAYHYLWFHFALRDRMFRANGHTDNHVSWRGKSAIVPFEPSWSLLASWVEAIKKDTGRGTLREKSTRNKPANAVDGCWKTPTEFVKEPATLSSKPDTPCNALVPGWTFPRHVANGPIAADILKCQLKRIDRRDYPVSMSDEEFKRLKAIFPEGVCDWTKKSIGHAAMVPWASFGPAPENLVFDITTQR